MQIAMQVLYSYLFSVMLVILGVGVINQIVHFNATKQRSIAAKKLYLSFTVRLTTMLSFEHLPWCGHAVLYS